MTSTSDPREAAPGRRCRGDRGATFVALVMATGVVLVIVTAIMQVIVFQYGKGAVHFRSKRRARRKSGVRLEPPAFYYEMLASPFKAGSTQPLVGSLLLLASQSALLAGAATRAATLALGGGRA